MDQQHRYALQFLERIEKPTILFRGVPLEKFCQDDLIKIIGLLRVAAEKGTFHHNDPLAAKKRKCVVGQQVVWAGEVAIIQGLYGDPDKAKTWAILRLFGQDGTHHVNVDLLQPYVKGEKGPTYDF